MVKLIIGNEGTGKTLRLLDLANNAIKDANGHLVYLDKSTRHMYEINNKVRLSDVSEFNFSSIDEFYGFVCGIISQDRDIEQLYFDSFKKLGKFDISEVGAVLDKFDKLSEKCGITFNMAMSVDEADIPDSYKDSILK